jgi:hypothetical protein
MVTGGRRIAETMKGAGILLCGRIARDTDAANKRFLIDYETTFFAEKAGRLSFQVRAFRTTVVGTAPTQRCVL